MNSKKSSAAPGQIIQAAQTAQMQSGIDVYVVVGAQNSGKSSNIHALTGVRKIERSWQVIYTINGNPINTFVHPRSLQERGITSANFVNEVVASGSKKVIITLRDVFAGRIYPDAISYLNYFVSIGWNIKNPIGLGTPSFHWPGLLILPGRPTQTTNATAAYIRQHWNLP